MDKTTLEMEHLHKMPGFLMRRCSQISVAILHESTAAYDLTVTEWAILWALEASSGIDQTGLSNWLAVDRSSIARLVDGLEKRSLLKRATSAQDKRIKCMYATKKGTKVFKKARNSVELAQKQIMEPLSKAEANTFIELLHKLVNSNNEYSRAPLRLTVRE